MIALVSFVLAIKTFHDATRWFGLAQMTGLTEAQAKTISVEQHGDVLSIRYQYQVVNAVNQATTYVGDDEIRDVSLDIINREHSYAQYVPIEYLPDAPAYSIVSKYGFPEYYTEQWENSLTEKWGNALPVPAICALVSFACLIALVRAVRRRIRR